MDKKKIKIELKPVKKGYRAWSNYEFTVSDMEHQSDKEDKTIPDDSYTIKEIVHKFVKGQPLNIRTNIPYYDNLDIDDMPLEKQQGFDLAEAHEAMENLAERIKEQKETEKQNKRSAKKQKDLKNPDDPDDITKAKDKTGDLNKMNDDEGGVNTNEN